jgi:uncharacterized repeat protein (TIGR03803 family)
MTKPSGWKRVILLRLLCATVAIAAHAQTFHSLMSFDGTDGGALSDSLVQGPDGSLFGTAADGGAFGQGTVFKITPQGALTVVHSLGYTEGEGPIGALSLGTDGSFYGVTQNGGTYACVLGCGTVFKVTPEGSFTTLHSFCSESAVCNDGGIPFGGLIQGFDKNFYGTASGGSYDDGVVFTITPQGRLAILHSFDGTDGANPQTGLVLATDGEFYGTTTGGGANFDGTIFRIDPSGALRTLYSFCSYRSGNCPDGSQPTAGLVQGNDGNFYGTTYYGGDPNCNAPTGCGTVFKMTPAGTLTTLHTFELTDGASSSSRLVQATDGNLYGTTVWGGSASCDGGCGTVFAITLEGVLTTLHAFDLSDGEDPYGGLTQATNGRFYGTTAGGGTYFVGTAFSLDVGLGPFVSFVRSYGKVGQTGGILGQGLTGTTSVLFNGTPASFTVVSDTFIRATVPRGATTGFVTVTTPTGTLTSNVPFRVLP